jgi:DNA ligase-1
MEGQRWRNIMKCYPFEEKRLVKWNPPYIVQLKLNGVRCRVIPITSGHLLVSSEENIIYSVPHLNEVFDKLKTKDELDGELYCHGMSFEDIVSITSRTVNIHPDHKKIKFHMFDIVNEQPQISRLLAVERYRDLSEHIQVTPFWICENLDDIMRSYDLIINLGYEGIIVRHSYGFYERKRSTWVMKFKPKKEDNYEIVGVQEELDKRGKPKGSLGALICKSGDDNWFHVGTGFTADDRQKLWKLKDTLVGNIATIKYQQLTSGRQVPRFPVFISVMEK